METQPTQDDRQPVQELLLKADEVDAGTTIKSPGDTRPLSALTTSGNPPSPAKPAVPTRPGLRRETSTPPPPPPSQPPPAPPTQPEDPTDSLSLPQLRQLVRHFPKPEAKAFAYQYQDAQEFAIEIDEWFHYTAPDQDRDYLLTAQESFEDSWQSYARTVLKRKDITWLDAERAQQTDFIEHVGPRIKSDDISERQRAVASLLFVLCGVWKLTAGTDQSPDDKTDDKPIGNLVQIEWMHKNVDLVIATGVTGPLYDNLRKALERPFADAGAKQDGEDAYEGLFDDAQYCEISLCLSCFYMIVESARSRIDHEAGRAIRRHLLNRRPDFLVFLTRTVSRLRWDETYNIPLMHAVQLLWKSILLAFGDTKDCIERLKNDLQPRADRFSADACKPILTASPLDYHLFRQEITSKYPAYNPPLPLIPLENDQRTILPPLPHHAAKIETFDAFHKQGQPSGSIMHQPVHIATPAPSPPPSPAGPGGKGGKKQNYQTNQNFPFLYPPLDSDSNSIGGRGGAQHQDATVGRKWEGSDIPASILEAGELFASRMRMTRAMKQLWKERDEFMRYDRGWSSQSKDEAQRKHDSKKEVANGDRAQDVELQDRMDVVEEYFHKALPDLQSLIIVMMKVMLTNVQDISVRNTQLQETQNLQGALHRSKSTSNLNNAPNTIPNPPSPPRPSEMTLDDLDNIRTREVSQKAISACLFLMLKWFKISHILKFEYITQLLLDSNYIQLTLKYFAHQNLEELVSFRYDRDDLSFWRYCQLHSDRPPLSPTSPSHHSDHEGSDDDAVPPPIQRHRRSSTSASDGAESNQAQKGEQGSITISTPIDQNAPTASPQPLVDELGNPLTDFPANPLPVDSFSTRHFHTSISLLRILQKVTRGKAHRVLLLVSFKSAQILRRILRVPEPTLRLYVLKLFKSQVPYCGRKWRQSNMRVITAIYLHCRPELRDEWLAGLHDAAPGAGMGGPGADGQGGDYEEAVPLEWGLRGLTFWWMKRQYGDMMKLKSQRNRKPGEDSKATDEEAGQEVNDEERDFFKRELDAVGWGLAEMRFRGEGEDVGFGEEAPGLNNEVVSGVNGTQQPPTPVPGQNRGQDFGMHSARWAAESPNSEFGPMGECRETDSIVQGCDERQPRRRSEGNAKSQDVTGSSSSARPRPNQRSDSAPTIASIQDARSALLSNPLFRMTPMKPRNTSDRSTGPEPVSSPTSRPQHTRSRSADYAHQHPKYLHEELNELFAADYSHPEDNTEEGRARIRTETKETDDFSWATDELVEDSDDDEEDFGEMIDIAQQKRRGT
ncbi:Factor arrest protein 11 [Lithohypha guttulata]|uniref:Factor arrest protein 11 n=1 Tax=Lithohypha guttulata TaxID=1690604 RepID=A0AAN7T2T6_9EURO|nr:Factor arrest protein 11 [Lithohypha guttulata]